MHGAAQQAPSVRIALPLQLAGKQQRRQFRLRVRGPRFVLALSMQIFKPYLAKMMGQAAYLHHPRKSAPEKQRKQPAGQRKVAQVVGAELQFEPVRGNSPRGQSHHARVVDQQVHRTPCCDKTFRKGSHGGKARKIQFLEAHQGLRRQCPYLSRRSSALRIVAPGDDHVCAALRQG